MSDEKINELIASIQHGFYSLRNEINSYMGNMEEDITKLKKQFCESRQVTCYEWTGKVMPKLPSPNPEDWYEVASKSGKTADGFPMGTYLCPTLLDVSDLICNKKISDPMIRKYKKEPVSGAVYYEF